MAYPKSSPRMLMLSAPHSRVACFFFMFAAQDEFNDHSETMGVTPGYEPSDVEEDSADESDDISADRSSEESQEDVELSDDESIDHQEWKSTYDFIDVKQIRLRINGLRTEETSMFVNVHQIIRNQLCSEIHGGKGNLSEDEEVNLLLRLFIMAGELSKVLNVKSTVSDAFEDHDSRVLVHAVAAQIAAAGEKDGKWDPYMYSKAACSRKFVVKDRKTFSKLIRKRIPKEEVSSNCGNVVAKGLADLLEAYSERMKPFRLKEGLRVYSLDDHKITTRRSMRNTTSAFTTLLNNKRTVMVMHAVVDPRTLLWYGGAMQRMGYTMEECVKTLDEKIDFIRGSKIVLDRGYGKGITEDLLIQNGGECLGTHKRSKSFPYVYYETKTDFRRFKEKCGRKIVMTKGTECIYLSKSKQIATEMGSLVAVAKRTGMGHVCLFRYFSHIPERLTLNMRCSDVITKCEYDDGVPKLTYKFHGRRVPGNAENKFRKHLMSSNLTFLTQDQCGTEWIYARCLRLTSTTAARVICTLKTESKIEMEDVKPLLRMYARSVVDVANLSVEQAWEYSTGELAFCPKDGCGGRVRDGVQCEGCSEWYHGVCMKMDWWKDAKGIDVEAIGSEAVDWYCGVCMECPVAGMCIRIANGEYENADGTSLKEVQLAVVKKSKKGTKKAVRSQTDPSKKELERKAIFMKYCDKLFRGLNDQQKELVRKELGKLHKKQLVILLKYRDLGISGGKALLIDRVIKCKQLPQRDKEPTSVWPALLKCWMLRRLKSSHLKVGHENEPLLMDQINSFLKNQNEGAYQGHCPWHLHHIRTVGLLARKTETYKATSLDGFGWLGKPGELTVDTPLHACGIEFKTRTAPRTIDELRKVIPAKIGKFWHFRINRTKQRSVEIKIVTRGDIPKKKRGKEHARRMEPQEWLDVLVERAHYLQCLHHASVACLPYVLLVVGEPGRIQYCVLLQFSIVWRRLYSGLLQKIYREYLIKFYECVDSGLNPASQESRRDGTGEDAIVPIIEDVLEQIPDSAFESRGELSHCVDKTAIRQRLHIWSKFEELRRNHFALYGLPRVRQFQPIQFARYNLQMCGVDRYGQTIKSGRIRFKRMHNCQVLFLEVVQTMLYNAFQAYRIVHINLDDVAHTPWHELVDRKLDVRLPDGTRATFSTFCKWIVEGGYLFQSRRKFLEKIKRIRSKKDKNAIPLTPFQTPNQSSGTPAQPSLSVFNTPLYHGGYGLTMLDEQEGKHHELVTVYGSERKETGSIDWEGLFNVKMRAIAGGNFVAAVEKLIKGANPRTGSAAETAKLGLKKDYRRICVVCQILYNLYRETVIEKLSKSIQDQMPAMDLRAGAVCGGCYAHLCSKACFKVFHTAEFASMTGMQVLQARQQVVAGMEAYRYQVFQSVFSPSNRKRKRQR